MNPFSHSVPHQGHNFPMCLMVYILNQSAIVMMSLLRDIPLEATENSTI
jgi:hypothetical protein